MSERWELIHEGAQPPECSILMPIREQEATIVEALESVLGQEGAVCEILVSDDASRDRTFDLAVDTIRRLVASTGSPHTVRARRCHERRWRNHVHDMAAAASTDIMIQCHGDDISRPDRARRVVDAFATSGVAMVVSGFDVIDGDGHFLERVRTGVEGTAPIERLLEQPLWLIGALMSWRRSSMSQLPTLTMETAPVSHDHIMAVRAALIGDVVVIDEPLLSYRRHLGNTNRRLSDNRTQGTREFGEALTRSFLVEVLADDLAEVRSWPGREVGEADLVVLDRWLTAQREQSSRQLRASYGELLRSGRSLLWVDEDELALANEGALGDRLRQRAMAAVPLRTMAERARRALGRIRRLAVSRIDRIG